MPARTATPITRSSASPRPYGRGKAGEQLMINYNSALKVVNLGEPEASLILRKPRSPQGQGGPDPASPTGLIARRRTAMGKHRTSRPTRSSSTGFARHPGPQLRAWCTSVSRPIATRPATSRPWPATATSRRSGTPSSSARCPDTRTSWSLTSAPRRVEGLLYVPRQDSPNGRVKDFEICVSDRRQDLEQPLAAGRWPNDPSFKYVALPAQSRAYVQLRGLSEVEGRPVMSAAEVAVESTPLPDRAALAP